MRIIVLIMSAALILGAVVPAQAAFVSPSSLALPMPEGDPVARLAQADPTGSGSTAADRLGDGGEIGRSLLIPGWGQWEQNRRGLALVFFGVEAAIWTTFAVSMVQSELRENSAEQTAALFAGIDLNSVDDEIRELVGQYRSSDEYNRLVVSRDAAALYFGDPVAYNQYIDENSLRGNETWKWSTEDKFQEYGAERRSSDRANQRAQFTLALAAVNRFASALAAWRLGPTSPSPTSLAPSIETPGAGRLEWAMVPGPKGLFEHRIAWSVGF